MKFLSTLVFLLCPIALFGQFDQESTFYIWDFSSRSGEQTEMTENLTREFEEILVNNGCCEIIERRAISELLMQVDNEMAIRETIEIPKNSLDKLKSKGADIVIFGDVHDDTEAGQFVVTVTYQGLDGKKHLVRSASLSKARINIRESRFDLVSQLIPFPTNSVGESTTRPSELRRLIIDDLIVDLKECKKEARNVTCIFELTNNEADRTVYLNYKKSSMFDGNGNKYASTKASLANSTNHRAYRGIYLLVINGVPITGTIQFDGVSNKSKTISRLDMKFLVDKNRPEFVFRDISID